MSEKQDFFTLLNGKITMQHSFYNPTSDAVWLAACVPNNVHSVLDIGIGTGGVSLCIKAENPNVSTIVGIDVSKEMLESCEKNCKLNSLKIDLVHNDLNKWSTQQVFDCVVTNPPYFYGTPAKHKAHHNIDIIQWIDKSTARVKPSGFFCTIVDSLLLDKVLYVLSKKHFGNIQIFPLFSKKICSERVLLRAKQGVKTGVSLYRGFNMNNESILRDGLTIDALLSTLSSTKEDK
ncbi:MAG: methyltransferase [Alphaproteobacteria bacterium]|nr:methyltransferase [Alphaproteobacteria bacterium]